eukprot:s458_g1.t1
MQDRSAMGQLHSDSFSLTELLGSATPQSMGVLGFSSTIVALGFSSTVEVILEDVGKVPDEELLWEVFGEVGLGVPLVFLGLSVFFGISSLDTFSFVGDAEPSFM